MLTDKWETLQEVAERTGVAPEAVAEFVRVAFRTGKASMRIDNKRIEWTKENADVQESN